MSEKTLISIVGPPAVGKMAVGRELERRTGLPLLHNHMTIELVLPFFDFGSPPFDRLVGDFRRQLVEAVVEGDGPGLIFTYVWAFEMEEDAKWVDWLTSAFTSRGDRAVFVELYAPLETRLERNSTPLRLAEKASKRDLAASRDRVRKIDARYRMNSGGDFPYADHLFIDNTLISVAEAADRVMEYFSLPETGDHTLGRP